MTPPHDRTPTSPTGFTRAPGYGSSGRPGPVQQVYNPAGYVAPPRPRSVPVLTVPPTGLAYFSAEASGLLSGLAAICVRRPPVVRRGRTPQLWEVGPGECLDLLPHPAKLSQLRVHFPAGEGPPPGEYLLLPVAGAPSRFSLYPQ